MIDLQIENSRVKNETESRITHLLADKHLLKITIAKGEIAIVEMNELKERIGSGLYDLGAVNKWLEEQIKLEHRIAEMNEARRQISLLEPKLKHNMIIYAGI